MCRDVVNGYQCICPAGYAGPQCEILLNACASVPCKNDGTCLNTGDGTFVCVCPAGFTSVECEQEIYECGSNPCQHGGQCIDMVNRYTCQCPAGYAGELSICLSVSRSVCVSVGLWVGLFVSL